MPGCPTLCAEPSAGGREPACSCCGSPFDPGECRVVVTSGAYPGVRAEVCGPCFVNSAGPSGESMLRMVERLFPAEALARRADAGRGSGDRRRGSARKGREGLPPAAVRGRRRNGGRPTATGPAGRCS